MQRLHTLSQHFLRSPRLVAELIGHSSIKRSDTVYDIGAGSGVISAVLAQRAQRVVAVEADPRLVATLRANMQSHQNVTVMQTDFLQMALPSTPYKVFANIPFSLSAPIVRKLTDGAHPPQAAYLIVQKQFANKLLPESPGYTNQLAIMIGPQFAVRVRRHLQRTDFMPRPNVDTVLLEITHRPTPLIPSEELPVFKQFVIAAFTEPRLMAKTPLTAIGLQSGTKASQLTLSQWLALFAASKR